jgi:hypothetical protein
MIQDFNYKKKSSEKDLKKAPLPPLPFAEQMKREEESREKEKRRENIMKKEGQLTIEEANILLADMKTKQEELKGKLDEMYARREMTPQYLKLYMSNPSNFTPEQWKELNSQRQALVDSLNIPPELQEKKSSSDALNDSRMTKERRSKIAASRRRNWLPMR